MLPSALPTALPTALAARSVLGVLIALGLPGCHSPATAEPRDPKQSVPMSSRDAVMEPGAASRTPACDSTRKATRAWN